jgi:hypothetical protein
MPLWDSSNTVWHPNLEVAVKPKARSSMSSSSSEGSGRLSNTSASSITWQVEHAQTPSHAPAWSHVTALKRLPSSIPSSSMPSRWATVNKFIPTFAGVDVIFPCLSFQFTVMLKDVNNNIVRSYQLTIPCCVVKVSSLMLQHSGCYDSPHISCNLRNWKTRFHIYIQIVMIQ